MEREGEGGNGWKGRGGTDGGEGEGLIGREGVVLGLVAMSSLLFVMLFLSCIPVVMSLLSACLHVPPLLCPPSPSSLSCGCSVLLSSIVFPCGCCGARCQQTRRDEVGKGGAGHGVVLLFGIWVLYRDSDVAPGC